MLLKGKKILLGVCGSIAAYKSAHLVRLLTQQGADVRVILTKESQKFVTPLLFSVLSKNEVYSEFSTQNTWNNHVELGMWADIFILAPATANTIAKMAHGLCDELLLATYLSCKCKVMVAPAMDVDMYHHITSKENMMTLHKHGVYVLPSPKGSLASGLEGEGRMLEPEDILKEISHYLKKKSKLSGKKVLVTAGPTYEKIDPVRYIGNFSSGKMGFAIAEVAFEMGAEVILISGPVQLNTNPLIKRINVLSADEMFLECKKNSKHQDIIIMSAAVADFKPKEISSKKIKKNKDAQPTIELEKNIDILEYLGKNKQKGQVLCGFALETDHELENAKEKIQKKNLDYIILNSLNDKGAGFGTDTNKVSIISKSKEITKLPLLSKKQVAEKIFETIV